MQAAWPASEKLCAAQLLHTVLFVSEQAVEAYFPAAQEAQAEHGA